MTQRTHDRRRPDPASTPELRTVLHVTEAFGGGTESAIREFVAATPDLEHHLLFQARSSTQTSVDFAAFATFTSVRSGLVTFRSALTREVQALRPDVVHLHSSWAGLLGRTTRRVARHSAIVYSPHCFYFERKDISLPKVWLAKGTERTLARRTDVLIAVSPHEQRLASRIGTRRTVFVRNLIRGWAPTTQTIPPRDTPRIATLGRVSAQKDPDFFIDVVNHVRSLGVEVEWVWIGGGDDQGAMDRLRAAGVDVTGWLPRDRAASILASSSVYVHTAAWESGPVSIEEARLAGLRMALRSIPSLVSLGFPAGLDTPAQLAGEVVRLLATPPPVPMVGAERHEELSRQAGRLTAAYRLALDVAHSRTRHDSPHALTGGSTRA